VPFPAKEMVMGFYTEYDGGDMVIRDQQFSAFLEALPRLMEAYQSSAEDIEKVYQANITYYQKKVAEGQMWAKPFLHLPEQTQRVLASLESLADGHFSFQYMAEEGIKISFDSKKNWDWSLLDDLAPFLQEGMYMQVDDDNGAVRRYVVENKKIKVVLPSW
jgi:hypothetical protein